MIPSLVGTWRLVRAEAWDGDGRPLPPPYGGAQAMGHLVFTASGRMMAVLCDGRPALPAGVVREYNSYCGNYTFDGTRLSTTVDAAATGIPVGSVQVRAVSMEGDLLVLRPPPRRDGNGTVQRMLVWERLPTP